MSFNFYHIKTNDFTAYTGGSHSNIITRDNYEEWLVMYVDNELNEAGRLAVEQFIQQNPDLEEELVMLQQSVLLPDEQIVYEQKETLFKNTIAKEPVNENNCSAWFVLYGDDELTNEEKDKVEVFVYKHPQYQQEFELIQQAKLVPDKSITFPEKAYLYRTEEDDNKVIAFPWWRLSAAAIALLVLGSLAWYLSVQLNHTEVAETVTTTKPNTAKINSPQTTDTNKSEAPQPANRIPLKESVDTENKADVTSIDNNPTDKPRTLTVNNKKNISIARNIQPPVNVTHESTLPPMTPKQKENDFAAKPVAVVVGNSYTRPAVNGTVIQKPVNEQLAVNTSGEVAANESNDTEHTYVLNTSINKTPLRGFFRKVSRVVDKVTNPDENGKGGVRIANLEIALK
jgi:hypothetical protein